MKRRRAIGRLFALHRARAELCRVSDHLCAGPFLRYGVDRYGQGVERCPYCGGRL